jgi:hypothetical protein
VHGNSWHGSSYKWQQPQMAAATNDSSYNGNRRNESSFIAPAAYGSNCNVTS